MAIHKNIADSELHEIKGAAGASTGQVPISNGSGGSPFGYLPFVMTVSINDINTAGSRWVVSPYTATVDKIYTAIDSATSGIDSSITFSIGGTSITGSTITITEAGSAGGDIDSSTPTANNTVSAGQAIKIDWDGNPNSITALQITFLLTRTA